MVKMTAIIHKTRDNSAYKEFDHLRNTKDCIQWYTLKVNNLYRLQCERVLQSKKDTSDVGIYYKMFFLSLFTKSDHF